MFASLKNLELSDLQVIQSFTTKFQPYSDYNFVSLWVYDTNSEIKFGFINNNLVVKFTDYITSKSFYSFMGTNKIVETSSTLLDLSQQEGLGNSLKLIPSLDASIVELLSSNGFLVSEDPDNFDYIYDIHNHIEMVGPAYARHRNLIHRFHEISPTAECHLIDINDAQIQKELLKTFDLWKHAKAEKKDTDMDLDHEFTAFKRLLKSSGEFDLVTLGLFIDNNLQGFIIGELLHSEYAMGHFKKFAMHLDGISRVLEHELAKKLIVAGCKYINAEQDLGITGLKTSKQSWNPVFYLKKCVISRN